jgi:hypothetical protein
MSDINIGFQVMPHANSSLVGSTLVTMQHRDDPQANEEELALRNMLTYKQSYFWFNDTNNILPTVLFNNETVPHAKSEDYCLHLWWK